MRARMQNGFTYVATLFAVAVIGIGLAAKGVQWHAAKQREREVELLFIGEEFRRAIALYYYRTPGAAREYPKSLDDLIEDNRYPGVQRYLRQIYRDPMTGKREWGLIHHVQGGIMGVHSLSRGVPMKTGGFSPQQHTLSSRTSYAEWHFVFVPIEPTGPAKSARK